MTDEIEQNPIVEKAVGQLNAKRERELARAEILAEPDSTRYKVLAVLEFYQTKLGTPEAITPEQLTEAILSLGEKDYLTGAVVNVLRVLELDMGKGSVVETLFKAVVDHAVAGKKWLPNTDDLPDNINAILANGHGRQEDARVIAKGNLEEMIGRFYPSVGQSTVLTFDGRGKHTVVEQLLARCVERGDYQGIEVAIGRLNRNRLELGRNGNVSPEYSQEVDTLRTAMIAAYNQAVLNVMATNEESLGELANTLAKVVSSCFAEVETKDILARAISKLTEEGVKRRKGVTLPGAGTVSPGTVREPAQHHRSRKSRFGHEMDGHSARSPQPLRRVRS